MKKEISKKRIIIINILMIAVATIIAIVVHALVPTDTNSEDFDSIFVKALSFPVVASLYFVILFTHCAIMSCHFGEKSTANSLQIGLRFGIAFATLYLLGMQEVVVSSSPFNEWGMDFFIYQLIMGLSDAIPALLLCIVLAALTLKKSLEQVPKNNVSLTILTVCLIAAVFTAIRAIGYHTGIIGSDVTDYPMQTYIWTVLFGLGLGFIFVLLRPIYINESMVSVKLSLLTIGLNWIIFNSFIGLIFKGLMWEMLFRSVLDILPFFVVTYYLESLYRKKENSNASKVSKTK